MATARERRLERSGATMIRAREFAAFTLVGTAATGLNMIVVAGLVPWGVAPLVANVIGFLVSFVWGFVGHARWTFPAADRPIAPALRRFAVLSVAGFALNEVFYAGALSWTALDYRLALFAVIASLGLVKLLASKHWAFATA
jgi:putative flippase GtrA